MEQRSATRRAPASSRAAIVAPIAAIAASFVLAIAPGCSSEQRALSLPEPALVLRPEFVERPEDLADSRQLDAVPIRDTAGLAPSKVAANGGLLPDALAALAAIDGAPAALTRIAIYSDSVILTFNERGIAGRSVSAFYRLPFEFDTDQRPDLSIGEPTFSDAIEFSISAVDPTVPARLVQALAERFPLAVVDSLDLDVDLSYGFGLVWNIDLEDVRGQLATVFADLDGSIIAVEDET